MLNRYRNYMIILFMYTCISTAYASSAPKPWSSPSVSETIYTNVLYIPISADAIKNILIKDSNEVLIDLLAINNPRIQPLLNFDQKYQNTYDGYSKVRLSLYQKLLSMLEVLPSNVGIAYFEGYRTLQKQKEYFDNKLKEILETVKNKELAYQETTKHVSPFIHNIPVHATGAAIDITLFLSNGKSKKLIDMGKFGTIYGPNDQQETFSANTSKVQRQNRLILLEAATKVGFVNYGFEWWHYSYGDRPWAYVKHDTAIYGLVASKDDPILSIDKGTYLKSIINE